MPTSNRDRHAATTGVGAALVFAGAQRRARGLARLDPAVRPRMRRAPEAARVVLGRKAPEARQGTREWLQGSVIGAAGTAPVAAGVLGLQHDRKQRRTPKTVIVKSDPFDPYAVAQAGVKGAIDANRGLYQGHPATTDRHRGRAAALTAAAVLGASAGGGQLSRKVAPHILPAHLHPGTHAVTGALAGAVALPTAHKLSSRVVRRKKKVAVRPSTMSVTTEGRDNHPTRPFGKMDDPSGVHVNAPLGLVPTGRKRKPPFKVPVVKALVEMPPVNQKEKLHQLKRKRRQFALSTGATGAGVLALGSGIAGSKHIKLPTSITSHARHISQGAAGTAGAFGTGSALQGLQIQHHDLRNESQQLAKAHRAPTYRGSFVRTRRLSSGILKPVTVSAGLVR